MLRLTFVCLCCLVLGDGTSSFGNHWKLSALRSRLGASEPVTAPTEWQTRQRFLLDLLLQVHKPLLHQGLVELGSELNDDPREYKEGSWRLIREFLDSVHQNRVPRPFTIYNQLDEAMPQNLLGVYRFLVLARDWASFQRNACYARIHFHPILFVNALQIAVGDRKDTEDFILPAMFEVLPQLYFEKEVILAAQEIAWHQLTPIRLVTPKRRWKNIILRYLSPREPLPEEGPMSEDPLVIDNVRDLAHMSMDLELNSHWNNLINRLVISIEEANEGIQEHGIIDGDRLVAFRGPMDESTYKRQLAMGSHWHNSQIYLFNLKQFVAALSMEDLATGQRSSEVIDQPLMTTGGVPYQSTTLDAKAVRRVLDLTIDDLQKQIDEAVSHNKDYLENILIAEKIVANNYLNICRHLSLPINGYRVDQPSMLGLATANLRDPIYRSLLFRLEKTINSYTNGSITQAASGRMLPTINDVAVTPLLTYEETVYSDLINLIDQQLLQSQRNNLQFLRRHLVARQRRLNHEPFNITLDIEAYADMTVQARMYLAQPNQSRPHLHLDAFVCSFKKGFNQFERLFPSALTEPTLSELYEADYPSTSDISRRFPTHLLLPRGTPEGLQLQLFVELTAWTGWKQEEEEASSPVIAKSLKDVIIFHRQA
ncbi:hypothetical protein KR054_006324 [Drosophila jambulina]|nr:hypothetical protein KR054_006324 [Drosophila jambulina]